jgi:hypothetical protein
MGNRGRELLELASGPEPIGKFESRSSYRNADHIMVTLHNLRPDLQLAYKNLATCDRIEFAMWFLGQAQLVYEIPWGLIGPVLESFCDYLNSKSGDPLSVSLPAGLGG